MKLTYTPVPSDRLKNAYYVGIMHTFPNDPDCDDMELNCVTLYDCSEQDFIAYLNTIESVNRMTADINAAEPGFLTDQLIVTLDIFLTISKEKGREVPVLIDSNGKYGHMDTTDLHRHDENGVVFYVDVAP